MKIKKRLAFVLAVLMFANSISWPKLEINAENYNNSNISQNEVTFQNEIVSQNEMNFQTVTSTQNNVEPQNVILSENDFPTVSTNEASFSYKTEGETITITGLTDLTLTSIVIPDKINGLTVNKIGASAFANNSLLETVYIPDTVTYIGSSAFKDCISLAEVNIPNGIEMINTSTFMNCFSLTQIVIPESVSTIGNKAFYCCTNLQELTMPCSTIVAQSVIQENIVPSNYTLPYIHSEKITSSTYKYYSGPFTGCNNISKVRLTKGTGIMPNYTGSWSDSLYSSYYKLVPWNDCSIKEVVLDDGITQIGGYAFYNQKELVSITMPESLQIIGTNAFYNCEKLAKLDLPTNLEQIGNSAFYGCKKIETVDIPSAVEIIPQSVFSNCTSLKKVILPENIIEIQSGAFNNCTNLIETNIPNTVVKIGSSAFNNCISLAEVNIPSGIEVINTSTFMNCSSLTQIVIPESVSTIGGKAFYCCTNLQELTMPCSAIVQQSVIQENIVPSSYTLPYVHSEKLTSSTYKYYSGPFTGCNNISKVRLTKGTGIMTNYTGSWSESTNSSYYKLRPWNDSSIKEVVLDDGITQIGGYAFYNQKELVSVTMPESLQIIGSYAFYNCEKLAELNFPDVLEQIDTAAFINCKNIETVKIPNSVEIISQAVFSGCISLKNVVLPETVTEIQSAAFNNCTSLLKIYIPDAVTTIGTSAITNKNTIIYANDGSAASLYAAKNNLKCYSTKKIALDKEDIILYQNDEETLYATVTRLNDSINSTAKIVWTSSNTNVIDVTNGVLKVNGPGNAKITASFQGESASCNVTVYYKLEAISVANNNEKIYIDRSKNITVDFTPSNTTDDRTIMWSSSNEDIVKVEPSAIDTCTIYGVSKGTAVITATSVMGMETKFNVSVMIDTKQISIDETLELNRGETSQLKKNVFPLDTTDSFVWESENEDVAVVGDDGLVSAVGIGETIIRVTAESGVTAECIVTVKAKATDIVCSVEKMSMYADDTNQLEVSLLPIDTTDTYKLTSSNEDIVVVDEYGVVTAIKAGKTVITVKTDSGLTKAINVEVLPAYHISEITISSNDIVVECGEEKEVPYFVTPQNYTDKIFWESTDDNIFTVENGKIKGVNPGSAKVIIKGSHGITVEKDVRVIISSESICLNTTDKLISVGDTFDLEATLLPENTTDVCSYFSSNPTVATVNNEGTITALSPGECTITVSSTSGKQATCNLQVVVEKIIGSKEDILEISNVTDSEKVVLSSDIDISNKTITINKSAIVEIDLNGYKLMGLDTMIVNNGKLIISDSSPSGIGEIFCTSLKRDAANMTVVENKGTLVINSGKLSTTIDMGRIDLTALFAYTINNSGTIELNDGEVSSYISADVTSLATLYAYTIINTGKGNLVMNGGTVSAQIDNSLLVNSAKVGNNISAIYHNSSGEVALHSGEVKAYINQASNINNATVYCSSVWNNSYGTVIIDGAKLYSFNLGEYSPGKGFIDGITGKGKGIIDFLSGEILVYAEDYYGTGINNNENIIRDIGRNNPKNRDAVKIAVVSNYLGVGISDFNNVGFFVRCLDLKATHMAIASNGTVVIGDQNDKMNNEKIRLAISTAGFLFSQDDVYIYSGEFEGRISDASGNGSVKLLKGYEFSDKQLSQHRTRSVVLSKYKITYHLNGGINNPGNINQYTVRDTNITLKSPSREGYTFVGWYTDATMTQLCSQIETSKCQNIDLYAKWKKIISAENEGTLLNDDSTGAQYKVTQNLGTTGDVTYIAPVNSKKSTISIPDTINIDGVTYKVTAIENNAFKNSKLKKIIIGNNIIKIGENAFYNCTNLKTVQFGNNVTTIGNKAFYKCTALTKIVIPTKTTTIGKQAFYGCKKITSVTIGKNVNSIGSKAFYGCSKLKTLKIKTTKLTMKNIGSKAFSKTSKNLKVTIPKKKFKSYKSMLIKRGVNKKATFKKG